VPAFLDRLIYVEFLRERYQILKDINIDNNGLTLILQPAVARGVIKIIREQFLRWFKLGEVESRTERAVKVLSAIVKILQIEELENDEGLIEKLVNGELTFWDCLVAKKANSNNSKPAEKPKDTEDKPKEPADKEDWINELQANLDSIIDEAYEKAEDVSFDLSYATGIEREKPEDLLTEKYLNQLLNKEPEIEDKPLTDEELAKIRELRSKGLTVREIANQLNLPMVSVAKAVKNFRDKLLGCDSVEEFLEAVVH
jgi:hypothetical protein